MSVYKMHTVLAELHVVRKTGLVTTGDADKARRAVSLALQRLEFEDPDGDWWTFGTVMHMPAMEALGRRAVCEEEGHKLPLVVTAKTFGCQRCDYVFFGKAVGDL